MENRDRDSVARLVIFEAIAQLLAVPPNANC